MRKATATTAAALTALLLAVPASAQDADPTVIVFNGEGNRLNAYDVVTGQKQTVIPSAADVEGTSTPGRDINAQICFDPAHLDDDPATPNYFIAGEDTGQEGGQTVDGGQGWGYFELTGNAVGEFGWSQLGKMDPTYNNTADNPENYGCGFLSDGRLVTTDVGDQQPQSGANGQLIVWFPPFDRTDVPYCKIAVSIPTAGQVYVDPDDRVFVGSQRPDFNPFNQNPGGIYIYAGDWPTSDDATGGCGETDPKGSPMVDSGRITRTSFITAGHPFASTPSAIVPAPNGNFYVSSVFDGKISEFSPSGQPVRPVLVPPPGQPPYQTGTPFGLGIGPDGTLYYADIGIVLGPPPGPGNGNGSVRSIDPATGPPGSPEKLDDGLAFPDGIGILVLPAQQAAPTAPEPTPDPEPATLPATGGGLAAAALLLLGGASVKRRGA